MLQTCWIDTYLGPPDIISHDAGKTFVSKEFREYGQNIGTQTKGVPVEAHHSIGLVERYHGPLRRIYKIITAEIPGINKNLALQMTFKAFNDTARPDRLVPTLLAFGAYPRMTDLSVPSPTVSQRSNAIRVAMKELNRINSHRKINNALNMRNGPSTTELHDLPLNAPVMVWCEGNTGQAGHWDGPFSLISISDETFTLNLPSGPTQFRSTSVKPYLVEQTKSNNNIDSQATVLASPRLEATTPSNTPTPNSSSSSSLNQPAQ
ncbi:hypothetical protein K3495_g12656 [Podosphaera aphanis]|nr:hypothetical protein K3495_g12656 [Podosphaera aphanis]